MTDNEAIKLAVEMHREFNSLNTNFDLEFVLVEDMWFKNSYFDTVQYNTDHSYADLIEGSGNTYSLENCRVHYEDDDFYLVYGDNGCGDNYYALFLKVNEVSEDE